MSKEQVYIRPLKEEDAFISYKWRNNPKIWEYTGSRPDKKITHDIELKWIINVLENNNESRFAICVKITNKYIGNVQLTNIEDKKAEFHIFIGETYYWGRGFAKDATKLILDYAFNELKLNMVYLYVDKKNIPAIKVYDSIGFLIKKELNNEYYMIITNKKSK